MAIKIEFPRQVKGRKSKLTYDEALRRQQYRAEMIERYHRWRTAKEQKEAEGDRHGQTTRQ